MIPYWIRFDLLQGYEEILKFVNDVYVGMLSEDFTLSVSCELASALGMFGPDIPELDEKTGILTADSMVNWS